MSARDSYRSGFDLESGASSAAEPVTLPEDLSGPLVRKRNVFPQRRPDRKNLIGQTAGYGLSRSMEIVVHWKQSIGFELTKHPPQFLLDPIHGVKEISAIHTELPAAQLPIRAQQKVILEDTIFDFS
jgi:hypothetical protein